MRKSTVSKEQGIVRGGGGRRAKRVHKTRSDVADGKVLRVASRNHKGVQTPWQVNESGHGSGLFDRHNMSDKSHHLTQNRSERGGEDEESGMV